MKQMLLQEKYPVFVLELNKNETTSKLVDDIAARLRSAKNLVFCFGLQLPNPNVFAVRPRSIGVADCGDKFVINFLEAPMKPVNDVMEGWAKALRGIG